MQNLILNCVLILSLGNLPANDCFIRARHQAIFFYAQDSTRLGTMVQLVFFLLFLSVKREKAAIAVNSLAPTHSTTTSKAEALRRLFVSASRPQGFYISGGQVAATSPCDTPNDHYLAGAHLAVVLRATCGGLGCSVFTDYGTCVCAE